MSSAPSARIDPAGLFALNSQLNYYYVDVLPRAPNGSSPNRGGVADANFQGVGCRCTGCGHVWRLEECATTLNIELFLLNGIQDPNERAFYLRSEFEHAADFRAALEEFRRAGEAVENQERTKTFSSKEECESHAESSMIKALGPILQRVWNESKLKHDIPFLFGIFGPAPHTWVRH